MALIISLTIIGILLIIAEIVLIPGIFVAGTLGLLAMAGSCWLAFDQFGQTAGLITIAVNILLANGLIDPGQDVTVILIDDNKIYVKPK